MTITPYLLPSPTLFAFHGRDYEVALTLVLENSCRSGSSSHQKIDNMQRLKFITVWYLKTSHAYFRGVVESLLMGMLNMKFGFY